MIGQDIADALGFLRGEAESLQDTPFTFYYLQPSGQPDPVTGVVAPSLAVVWSGLARIKPMKRVTAGGVSAGEAKDSQNIYIISVPVDVSGLEPGMVGKATGSTDGDVVADTFRVLSVEDSSQTSAKRVTCELVEARS